MTAYLKSPVRRREALHTYSVGGHGREERREKREERDQHDSDERVGMAKKRVGP